MLKSNQNENFLRGTVKSVNVSLRDYNFELTFSKVYSNGNGFVYYFNLKETGTVKMTGSFQLLKYPGAELEFFPNQKLA